VLPAGLSLDEFPLRSGPPAAGPERLLFVGRLVRRKGVDVLLRALALLPDARLEVCGEGEERPALERLAAELGVAERVRFHGGLGRAEARDRLLDAHLLVLPSRTMPDGEVETLGVAILEALATGVPVVATRSGGIESAVPPSRRPELVPEDDPEELAQRISAVLAEPDPALRAREGRAWVEAEFDWTRQARRIAEVYERALSGPGPGASARPA
jgi:glycosyltransferase involved in cell wall biosynthesis